MTASFRELVDAAIEAHEPLDTPAFARLAEGASSADRDYWRSQICLDRAVSAWQRKSSDLPTRSLLRSTATIAAAAVLKTWHGVRSAQTAAALALGLSAVVVWSGREAAPPDAVVSAVAAVRTKPVATLRPPVVAQIPQMRLDDSQALAMADSAAPRDGFAEAAETAERLAYAFQPVGEQVGSVVRLLIDAVPGSDVFSM
jgi:hypothetical protein